MNRLAVLGHPVSHSRSPAMQTAALAELGLADEWSYEAIDLAPGEFDERTKALPEQGFVGVNVTIPHKEAALAVSDEASEAARRIGAANTLSFADGSIRADNTDAPGLLAALPESAQGKAALVLGAGGSARAVVWALAGAGAEVAVWNRTPDRAGELVRDLGTGRAVSSAAGPYELVVNCTAVGMEGEDPFDRLPIGPEHLDDGVTLVDLVYGGSETRLVAEARGRGARVVDGLEVLVRQGAESLRIWTGREAPIDVMREAARNG